MNRNKLFYAYLIAATLFTKELFGVMIGSSVVDLYLIAVSAFGLLIGFNAPLVTRVGLCWSALLALSATLLILFDYPMDILVNQGIPSAFVFMGIAGLLGFTDSASLIRAYRRVCLGASCFGILQFAASFAGLRLLMKEPGRLDSLAYEPSHYAIVIAPAAFLALRQMFQSRRFADWRIWVVVGSLALTFSVTGLILLIVGVLLTLFRRNGYVAVLALVFFSFLLVSGSSYLPELIRVRVEAFTEAIEGDIEADEISNLSVMSPLTNWEVANDAISRGRVLGNGIGGHFHAYNEYYGVTGFAEDYRFGTNAMGAHSLIIRVYSELGFLGLGAYLGFIFLGLREAARDRKPWLILGAIYLIGRMIKLGGFMEIGLPIFILAPFAFNQVFVSSPEISSKRRGPRPKIRASAVAQS